MEDMIYTSSLPKSTVFRAYLEADGFVPGSPLCPFCDYIVSNSRGWIRHITTKHRSNKDVIRMNVIYDVMKSLSLKSYNGYQEVRAEVWRQMDVVPYMRYPYISRDEAWAEAKNYLGGGYYFIVEGIYGKEIYVKYKGLYDGGEYGYLKVSKTVDGEYNVEEVEEW